RRARRRRVLGVLPRQDLYAGPSAVRSRRARGLRDAESLARRCRAEGLERPAVGRLRQPLHAQRSSPAADGGVFGDQEGLASVETDVVQNGLYKTEYQTPVGNGRGVICARDGRLFGGNSNFAFIGRFETSGDTIAAEVSTVRHNHDLTIQPLLGADVITVKLTGRPIAGGFAFEGATTGSPS